MRTDTVIVSAHHHDMDADNVQFERKEGEDAERTAKLLKECGYQVDIYLPDSTRTCTIPGCDCDL